MKPFQKQIPIEVPPPDHVVKSDPVLIQIFQCVRCSERANVLFKGCSYCQPCLAFDRSRGFI